MKENMVKDILKRQIKEASRERLEREYLLYIELFESKEKEANKLKLRVVELDKKIRLFIKREKRILEAINLTQDLHKILNRNLHGFATKYTEGIIRKFKLARGIYQGKSSDWSKEEKKLEQEFKERMASIPQNIKNKILEPIFIQSLNC